MTVSILFISANPQGTTRIEIDDEYRTIEQVLRGTRHAGNFSLLPPALAARVEDFQTRLLRDKPVIVHWSGHGQPEVPAARTGSDTERTRELTPAGSHGAATQSANGMIVVWGEGGQPEMVPTDPLANVFNILRDQLPTTCVVLNACFTEAQAKRIAEHVDFVVGTTRAIPDTAAIAFSKSFYEAIGEGQSLANAFELGKNNVAIRSLGDPRILKCWSREGVDPKNLILAAASPAIPAPSRFPEPSLTGPQLRSCHDVLLDAFPTRAAMAQLLLYDLDVKLDEITGQPALREAYFELLRWAKGQGRLGELFKHAIAANSGNLKLQSLVAQIWRQ